MIVNHHGTPNAKRNMTPYRHPPISEQNNQICSSTHRTPNVRGLVAPSSIPRPLWTSPLFFYLRGERSPKALSTDRAGTWEKREARRCLAKTTSGSRLFGVATHPTGTFLIIFWDGYFMLLPYLQSFCKAFTAS